MPDGRRFDDTRRHLKAGGTGGFSVIGVPERDSGAEPDGNKIEPGVGLTTGVADGEDNGPRLPLEIRAGSTTDRFPRDES